MAGPWEKYQAQAAPASGPWEKYAAPAAQPAARQPSEPIESIGRTVFDQGMQGATFGFGDEISDALAALGAGALSPDLTIPEAYDMARQLTKERQERQLRQNPGTALAANIAGGLATGIAGASTKAGTAVGNFLRAGNLPARAVKGALAGAASGGLYGLGAGEDGKRAESAKQGMLWGGAIGGVAPVLGAAVSRLNTKTNVPTSDEIRQKAGEMFRRAEAAGGTLKPEFTDEFVNAVERMKPQTEIGQIVGGDSAFTKVADKIGQIRGKPMTLNAAQELDELLSEAIDGFTEMGRVTKQGKKLLDVQNALRGMIDDAPETAVIGGKQGFDALKEARRLWSTSYRLNDIERIIQKADMYDQPATAIKTGFRTLYNNPNKMRGYSEAERKAIKAAAETGVVGDILRTAGSRLVPIVTGASSGGLGTTAAAAAGSAASRGIAARMQVGRASKAARAIAERSGLSTTEKRLQIPKNWREIMRLPPREAARAMERPALPSPKYADEFVSDKLGNVRRVMPEERAAIDAARQREVMLGMEPGTRMNIIRREMREKFGDTWNGIEKAERERIAFEINKAFRENPKASLDDLIEQARSNAAEYSAAKGEQFSPGAMGQALMRAKEKKR